MRDFLFFVAGSVFTLALIVVIALLDQLDRRRADRREKRPGYIQFDVSSKGGWPHEIVTPGGTEQGGGHVTSPPPLHLVKGEKHGS